MDDAGRLFRHMDLQEVVDLERATGLRIDDVEEWSEEDYDTVIAYLRRKALMPTALIPHPKRGLLSPCTPAHA